MNEGKKTWMICLGLSICGICLLLDGKTGWEGRERGEGVGLDLLSCVKYIYLSDDRSAQSRLGLGVWFFLRVEEVPGSIPGADPFWETFLGVSHAHHLWTYQVSSCCLFEPNCLSLRKVGEGLTFFIFSIHFHISLKPSIQYSFLWLVADDLFLQKKKLESISYS